MTSGVVDKTVRLEVGLSPSLEIGPLICVWTEPSNIVVAGLNFNNPLNHCATERA